MEKLDECLELTSERQWGNYTVIDITLYEDSMKSLTKHLKFIPYKSISYQRHRYRDESWVVTSGNAYFIMDESISRVGSAKCDRSNVKWEA